VKEARIIQGRTIGPEELGEIEGLLKAHPNWSRWRLSRALAEQWQWYSRGGQLKDMAARTLLLKLHERELITLPPRRRGFPPRRVVDPTPDLFEPETPKPIEEALSSLRPLRIHLLERRSGAYKIFQSYLARHHYLGYGGPVGENIGYLIQDNRGRDLACVLFGAAAWKCGDRDQWIGWTAAQRSGRLHLIANNSRFLILPWVRVPHLASHILGRITRRLSKDWQVKYGHRIELLETFVQCDRFRGTCYRAANWVEVGRTRGRTRQDRHHRIEVPIKAILIHPLHPQCRLRLCHEPT